MIFLCAIMLPTKAYFYLILLFIELRVFNLSYSITASWGFISLIFSIDVGYLLSQVPLDPANQDTNQKRKKQIIYVH